MRASVIYWLTFLALLALIVAPFGCAPRPMPTQTEKIVIKDSIVYREKETTDRTRKIIDSLNLLIGQIRTAKPECDSVCQAEVDRLLRQLNTSKQSGDNGYGIKYNELKKQLEIVLKVAESLKQQKETESIKLSDSDREVIKTLPVPFVPWYWKYSAYFGWFCVLAIVIYLAYRIWLPGLK